MRLRCTTIVVVVVVAFAATTFATRALPCSFGLPAMVVVGQICPVSARCGAPVLLSCYAVRAWQSVRVELRKT